MQKNKVCQTAELERKKKNLKCQKSREHLKLEWKTREWPKEIFDSREDLNSLGASDLLFYYIFNFYFLIGNASTWFKKITTINFAFILSSFISSPSSYKKHMSSLQSFQCCLGNNTLMSTHNLFFLYAQKVAFLLYATLWDLIFF